MTAPRPVPPEPEISDLDQFEPEISDLDQFEMVERHVIAYDALAGAVMVLSGVQSGDQSGEVDEWTIEKAMAQARRAADGLSAALQELGFKYGASSAREALYDWRGTPDRVA